MYSLQAWNQKAEQPWMLHVIGVPAETKDSAEVAWSVLRVAEKSDKNKILQHLDPQTTALPPWEDSGIRVLYGDNPFASVVVREYPLAPEAQ